MQPPRQLLPHLPHVTPQRLRLVPVSRPFKRLVQREARLARQTELLERQVREELLRGGGVRAALGGELGEAVGQEEDAVDEQPVGGAFDLEVAEEGVGAEEGEHFVEDVVGFRVRVHVEGGGCGRERGERVGGAACFGAQGEEGQVAYGSGDGGVRSSVGGGGGGLELAYLLIGRRCRRGILSGRPAGLSALDFGRRFVLARLTGMSGKNVRDAGRCTISTARHDHCMFRRV